jgi:hypothetical protein
VLIGAISPGTDIPRHKRGTCRNNLTSKYLRCQEMAKIINFPKQTRVAPVVEASLVLPLPKAKMPRKKLGIGSALIKIIWVPAVLLFPLVEWIIALDCVFQFFRMLYYWNTNGVHAGVTFGLHFIGYAALICFVALYKPKGM